MRPDPLEELLESISLQRGVDPERILRAKERLEQRQQKLREVEARKRKREPR